MCWLLISCVRLVGMWMKGLWLVGLVLSSSIWYCGLVLSWLVSI